jgi:hypothetical protein
LKNPITKNWAGGVVQCEGPEFKLQNCKKKKKSSSVPKKMQIPLSVLGWSLPFILIRLFKKTARVLRKATLSCTSHQKTFWNTSASFLIWMGSLLLCSNLFAISKAMGINFSKFQLKLYHLFNEAQR